MSKKGCFIFRNFVNYIYSKLIYLQHEYNYSIQSSAFSSGFLIQ